MRNVVHFQNMLADAKIQLEYKCSITLTVGDFLQYFGCHVHRRAAAVRQDAA